MRKLISFFLAIAAWMPMIGQNPNPQQNFNAQVQLAAPSLWMNYNDPTASFKDSVSGLGFLNTAPAVPAYVTQCTAQPASSSTITCALTATAANALVVSVSTGAGTISSVVDSGGCTPTAAPGSSYVNGANIGAAYVCANVSTGSHTITVTLSTTAAYPLLIVQAFSGVALTSPVDGTGSGQFTTTGSAFGSGSMTTTQNSDLLVGFGVSGAYVQLYAAAPLFTRVGGSGVNTTGGYLFEANPGSYAFNLTLASGSTGGGALIVALKPATVSSGTASLQQPGFDSTNPANYSAGFSYNGFNVAPNNTLGAIDWSSPWSMLVHIDRLNWNRTGTLVLASKGDIASTNNSWWKLTLTSAAQPSGAQLCFVRNGKTTSGSVLSVGNQTCTSVDISNGYNYDIVVTDSGAGTGAALNFYVNGVGSGILPLTSTSNSFQYGFGAVNLTISGGTGYAALTAFTSSGGGANCTVTGNIPATTGVPTAGILAQSRFNNYNAGCTSLPTITLTSPTGTGISIVPSLAGGSMNSTTYPVIAPGYVSGGAYNGIDQADSTQTATYVDEFAVWNRTLTPTEIYNLFYQTKFYQAILPAVPTHIPVILNEIVCADYDSTTTIAVAITLHQLGYINLLGLAIEGDGGLGAAIFRQELDQAGLNNVPIGMASNSSTLYPMADNGFCTHANITAYNASTPVTYAAYLTTSQMYRKIFAANPTTAITLLTPTTLYGTYDFMNSAADSISALTGAQLWLQNKNNGGSMYIQGGPFCGQTASLPVTSPCSGSVTGDNSLVYPTQGQYVLNNLQGLPLYMMANSPDSNGPGVLYTRTSKDPLYLASVTLGNDSRTGWDSLGTVALLTPLFSGSVQIAYSGGTGYANATQITSTGGGANCHVDGWLTASSGVPNGLRTSFGSNQGAVAWGNVYGHGCTSVPTLNLVSPTGTGVTLTAYLSAVCGTDTITYPGSVWTDSFSSATCSNQYTVTFPWQAAVTSSGGGSPIYRWLMNSLENPVPVGQPRVQ